MPRFATIILAVALVVAVVFMLTPDPPPCAVDPQQRDDRQADAGCLIVRDERVLLIRGRGSDKLSLPGGASRSAELAQCTAHRETWEETGLDVRVGGFIGRTETDFYLYDCTPVTVVDELAVPGFSIVEVAEVVWRDPATLTGADMRFPWQLGLLREAARR